MNLIDKLRSNSTITEGGCWEHNNAPVANGYRQVRIDGKKQYVHRLAIGAKDGDVVLHLCDNPSCCNPEHLRIGTQKDNVRDMFNKKRRTHQKLSDEIVLEILKETGTNVAVAKKYGVSHQLICDIRKGRAYVHLR